MWTARLLSAYSNNTHYCHLSRGLVVSECGGWEHLTVYLMEGRYVTSAFLRGRWVGAHPPRLLLTGSATCDRSHQYFRDMTRFLQGVISCLIQTLVLIL